MRKVYLVLIIFTFTLYSQSLTKAISALKENSDKVKDLQADVFMEMDMGEAGTKTQEMRVWSKGKERVRVGYSPEGLGYSSKKRKSGELPEKLCLRTL